MVHPRSNIEISSPRTCPYMFGEFTCTYRGSERCNFKAPVAEEGLAIITGKGATS